MKPNLLNEKLFRQLFLRAVTTTGSEAKAIKICGIASSTYYASKEKWREGLISGARARFFSSVEDKIGAENSLGNQKLRAHFLRVVAQTGSENIAQEHCMVDRTTYRKKKSEWRSGNLEGDLFEFFQQVQQKKGTVKMALHKTFLAGAKDNPHLILPWLAMMEPETYSRRAIENRATAGDADARPAPQLIIEYSHTLEEVRKLTLKSSETSEES